MLCLCIGQRNMRLTCDNKGYTTNRRDGLAWLGLAWAGLAWAGLGWVGLGWVGLSWLGLGWFKQAEQAVDWSVNFEERVNFSQVTPQKPDSRSSSIIGPKTIRFLGRKYESKRDKDRDRARECEVVQRIRSMIGW
ncbi:hypothetical protein HZH66_012598 [Vespula vulgaris]|uniref:Uncharacterized protein n=1 Tax=Vespula vulgaris TaxID=7454 RepID=A0A834MVC6_VESVU|nr:hypothetical protein HZH66_012598 [Vespula vulgaris]